MRKDREKAVALRQKGKSYAKITKKLGIPKATLSNWFRDQSWSVLTRDSLSTPSRLDTAQKIKKMALANRQRWAKWRQDARDKALKEFPTRQKDPLFLPAILLYWSRGDLNPKNSTIRFSTNDPDMLKLMFSFFSRLSAPVIPADKISCRLYLYPDLPDLAQKNFWSKTTGIPFASFKKSSILAGKPRAKRKSFGICIVSIYNRLLKEKLLQWIVLLKNSLSVF